MVRPLFGMNFFEEFSDFSTLDYDIPNLCKKREVHCTGSNYNPSPKNLKIVKKDQSMSLAML